MAPMEVPSLSSRLFVTVAAPRSEPQVLTSFSQNAAVWGLTGVNSRAKRARFAALEKVRSFVFNHFLASFPRFFYSLAVLWIPPTGRFRPPTSFPFEASAKTCEVLENSNSTREARISALNCGSIWVRFSFVLDVTSFVFNNILASVVIFFVVLNPSFPRLASTIPLFLSHPSIPALPLRQNVKKSTTKIGYHRLVGLSSEKCGPQCLSLNSRVGADSAFWSLRCPGGTRPQCGVLQGDATVLHGHDLG